MTWLQPWAAWFFAGLPVIVLLYLLKVRRRPATVSTLIFWQRVMQEHRRRALFQRLRHFLSLLLHLLIFALIVAALARPTFDRLVRDGASTVLILDTCARMQALEPDGETRFAKAVRLAQAAVRDASASRQFAIVSAGPKPEVLAPFTDAERPLQDALKAAAATDGGGDASSALALAEDLLATRKGAKRLVFFTDRAQALGNHPSLETRTVGTSRENLAITRFATRPLPASPQTSEIFIEVRNFAAQAVQANMELRYDDRLLDVKPVSIEPGGKLTLVFPSVPRPGNGARGQLTARLDARDAMPLDNVAYAMLPPPRPVRVLLVTRGNAFLEKALGADAGVSFELLAPEAWSEAIAGKFDVTLYDDFVPPAWKASQAFFIQRTPFDAPGDVLDRPPVTEIDSAHPALRLVDLSQTTILRAHRLAMPEADADWTYSALVSSLDHPIFLVGEQRSEPRRRVAALGLDLSATDLPLRVAFPLLVNQTLRWLAGTPAEAPLSFQPGEVRDGVVAPLRNGFHEIEREQRHEWIAVNTSSEAESDLRITSAGPSASPHVLGLGRLIPAAWPLWQWLALAAFGLLSLEWWLFHRRRTE